MTRGTWWALALVGAVFSLTSETRGQVVATKPPLSAEAPATEPVAVGRFLDGFLDKATVAADAASVVTEADKYRREAERMLKNGRRNEARALFRQAGEAIAAAAPDRDSKRDDPFLRQYLSEVTSALVALDASTAVSDQPLGVGASYGEGLNLANLANPRVTAFRDYWLGRGRQRLRIGRARFAEYGPMMGRIFREEGVPEWLLAVGFVESTYNVSALSPKQAAGIWQFIPATGARYGLQLTAWTDERRNPEKSTRAAARYLRRLHALFGDWSLALAGYNWGENRVARVMRKTGVRDFWTMAERGLVPQETANYVPAVLAAAQLLNPAVNRQVTRETSGQVPTDTSRGETLSSASLMAADLQVRRAEETQAQLNEQSSPALAETETLERIAQRYHVSVSEIRQTVPGYYDIPDTTNGRRSYVRIKKR